jgi:uncharacterized protein YbjT (DUF2867 family)
MGPTILVVGSTGNTGKGVIRYLPNLLQGSHRVLGLTRSLDNLVAQEHSKLPNVEMVEKDWTEIDADWLQENGVVRAFIAPHNLPTHFAEESAFHNALLEAGVQYVVRISTNAMHVGPTDPVYYGRSHWAIETLLSQKEFERLQWTSLQPNAFTATYLASAAQWIENYRQTGKQSTLRTNAAMDRPMAMVDPLDVGEIGAYLLALDDPSVHNKRRYVVSGPVDISGRQIVELVEDLAGVKVEKVAYKDVSWIDDLARSGAYPSKIRASIRAGCSAVWEGKCSLIGTPTSGAIKELCPPRRTPTDALQAMVGLQTVSKGK